MILDKFEVLRVNWMILTIQKSVDLSNRNHTCYKFNQIFKLIICV